MSVCIELIDNLLDIFDINNNEIDVLMHSIRRSKPQHQQTAFCFILKIFNNILQHPTDIRYQNVNYYTVLKKLHQCPVFVKVLEIAGFYKSGDGHRILFDTTTLSDLFHLRELLQMCQIKSAHKSITSETQNPLECVCCNRLQYIENRSVIYSTTNTHHKRNATCIECYVAIKKNQPFWHCDQKKHGDAFNICSKCIVNYDPIYFVSPGCEVRRMEALGQLDKKLDDNYETKTQPLCQDILSCSNLQTLNEVMKNYHNEAIQSIKSDINFNTLLDHFLHLFYKHNTDEEFQFIMECFEKCYIEKCDKFRRHYTRASNNGSILQQLLDKVHCYFCHSIDVGNRLSINEKNMIYCTEKDSQNQFVVDSKIRVSALNKIQKLKREKYQHICKAVTRLSKYNQFEPKVKNFKFYAFGEEFKYSENDHCLSILYGKYNNKREYGKHTVVYPKFITLKVELVNNNVAQITLEQFNNEYQKAKSHLFSAYCKNTYIDITLEHILSLMIYCNYTEVQYKFSKTYRKNIHQHSNFYHLGKHIKLAVHEYGVAIDREKKHFYHGITEKLMFPCYEISIKGPLSTSTSFEVAANFTDHNRGLLIEFGHTTDLCIKPKPKYLSVAWLSDYPNEAECLFIQNNNSLFELYNIWEVTLGCELKSILHALKFMHYIFHGLNFKSPILDELTKNLIQMIKENQLSKYCTEYKAFDSLIGYAESICNICYRKQQHIVMIEKYAFFWIVFFYSDGAIKLELLNRLFPKVKSVYVKGMNLSQTLLESMLEYAKKYREKRTPDLTIKTIKLRTKKKKMITFHVHTFSPKMISQYKAKFQELGNVDEEQNKTSPYIPVKALENN
eukprot:208311_1